MSSLAAVLNVAIVTMLASLCISCKSNDQSGTDPILRDVALITQDFHVDGPNQERSLELELDTSGDVAIHLTSDIICERGHITISSGTASATLYPNSKVVINKSWTPIPYFHNDRPVVQMVFRSAGCFISFTNLRREDGRPIMDMSDQLLPMQRGRGGKFQLKIETSADFVGKPVVFRRWFPV